MWGWLYTKVIVQAKTRLDAGEIEYKDVPWILNNYCRNLPVSQVLSLASL